MAATEDETRLAKSVGLFRQISIFLANQLTAAEFKAPGPTQNLIGRLSLAAVRQAEGIAALYQAGPYYAGQIGQLLRGLLEMWRVAAWLVAPDATLTRNQRAVGLWVRALSEERTTLEMQAQVEELNVPAARWKELENQEQLVEDAIKELLGEAKPKQPGGARNDYGILERPDRYIVFRRESETAHVGAIALGQMVAFQDDSHVHLGGESPIGDRARKLVIARDVLADIADIVVAELDLSAEAWAELRGTNLREFEASIGPLIGLNEEE